MKKKLQRLMCCLLTSATILSMIPDARAIGVGNDVSIGEPSNTNLIASTNHTLVSGVTESDVILNSDSGDEQVRCV